MATVTLTRAYLLNGKYYGPGAVDVEDAAIAERLNARETKLNMRAAKEQQRQIEAARAADAEEVEAPSVPRRTTARKA
jgi:hypothetical protein